jgi:hypothetical protein
MTLVDQAKVAAKRAGDAAQKGFGAARDKGQQLKLKRKLDKFAAELGYLTFRQREGESGLDAEVDRVVSEMRGVRAEQDALHE